MEGIVTVIVAVNRGGNLEVDGETYPLISLTEFRELYKKEDFKIYLKPWCPLVTLRSMLNAERVLKVFGYEVSR